MSGDTPVNVGVPIEWPDVDSASYRVRRMQTKLHQWARDDVSCRFDDLYNLVYDPAFLMHAWERVSTNRGARTPGVDAATVWKIRYRVGVEEFLREIREQLKARTFRPVEVRQVMIPKASGKLRKLGIPTVADRVVQASVKAVLEPIFEADFLPCSYGFRPNRRAHDAISEIQMLATHGYEWVLEADIEACFDQIDHVALMDRLRARIKDKRVCALVKAFLKAGVMTPTGERDASRTGTPQGGILSPLLANIALTALDEHFVRQWELDTARRRRRARNGLGNWRLIRYADDFVLMVFGQRHHAEALRHEAAAALRPLGLRLSADKTHVVHIDEGFDFLGITIRRRRKRGTQKHYVYTTPSKKAVQAIKERVRAKTHKSTRNMTVEAMLLTVNSTTRGWANYHRHGVAKDVFNAVDHHAWWRLAQWIRHKHRRITWSEFRRRFTTPGTWTLAHEGVRYTGASSVAVVRYRYRGTTIPTPWTPRPATPPA
jgi:RNA-directed DNA polymerase